MRKLISCLLALTVVLSLLAVPAFASSATGSGKEVTVTLSGTAKPGENLCTVTVKVSGAPVAGIEFYIYPPSDWEETGSSTADAEKLFDLVNYSGNTFRATGVKSGREVNGEWTAMTITYQMDKTATKDAKIEATAEVQVGPSGIYNADLQDHTVADPKDTFTVTIITAVLGDVDGNGSVNIVDVSKLFTWVRQKQTADKNPDACDIDHVNGINIIDVSKLFTAVRQKTPLS